MKSFSRDNEARLLELLGKESDHFKQILDMTEKQTELLAADDIGGFDESISRRQELIEKINGLHQESDVLMQSYLSFTDVPGGKKNGAIEKAAARIRETAAKCAALNDKLIISAKEKAEDYIKQIGKLSLSRKSIGAYVQGVPNDPELFDRKT